MESSRIGAIVASAQAGDPAAYKSLLEAYGHRLFGYFLRATSSQHDAEDLLGELMLKLVRQLKAYKDQGRFDQWLFRIAANMVRDRIRRRKAAMPTVSINTRDDRSQDIVDRLGSDDPPADAALLAAEASGRLHEALGKLDEVTRQMVLLRHFGDMSFKELAWTFDCPIGTVLAKVHRGLKSLRCIMEKMEEQDGTD